MEPILQCLEVSKTFGGVRALKKIDFSLNAGEVHALVGENGAGKSTLIRIISGAISPDEGKIFLRLQRVNINSPRAAQEIGISTVYQDPMVYPELNVIENIFLGREIKTRSGNINWKAQEERTRELFKTLDISPHFLKEPMGELSVGLQQLALIAKALTFEAKVIIFDEPTAILTSHETARLFDIIRKLRSRGVGIIYISHRLEEIFEICDRVTVMRDGNIVGLNPVSEITRDRIVEIMAGKLLVEEIEHSEVRAEEPILSVRNLTKKGRFRDISFDIYPGEILAFSGLVGSGRTDVAQTLFGLNPPDQGTILLDGKPVSFASPEEAMKQGISYLPEDRKSQGLFPILSTTYNISATIMARLSSSLGIVDIKRERSNAEHYIRDLNIKTPGQDAKVFGLSGGNQQKVVLAKWLGVEPKILILDEPTRGIDVASKSEIHHMIARLTEEGMAVVVISSELPEILKLADRVIVMHEGVISGFFEGEEITSENLIRAATGDRSILREVYTPVGERQR